jgi:hypothetical protein
MAYDPYDEWGGPEPFDPGRGFGPGDLFLGDLEDQIQPEVQVRSEKK